MQPVSEDRAIHIQSNPVRYIIYSCFCIALLAGLYWMSRLNYRLFHSIADIIVVFIAASVFIIIWSGRHLLDNHYYLCIGIAFLFFAIFDFLHVLGNKGMGVFPEYGNLGPAFYIVSRYILSVSFLIAPIFIRHRLHIALMFAICSLISILVILSIFIWQNFPVMYIEGLGLTSFKIISDYLIALIFLGAIGLLLINRQAFDAKVRRLILLSLILSIATGLAFTLYSDPFGIMNAGGHFLQIAAFALVYLAFIDTGLARPQNLLFRKLILSNEEIQKLNSALEKVNSDLKAKMDELERTDAALKKSEAQANSLIKFAPTAIFEVDINELRFISVNEAMCRMSGYTRDELYRMSPMSLLDQASRNALTERIKRLLADEHPDDAVEYPVRKKDDSIIFMSLQISLLNDQSEIAFIIGHDITARRIYEDQLQESEERFRELSETSPVGVSVTSDSGVIIYTNQSYEEILGYDHAELIGMPAIDLYWNPEERIAWIREIKNSGHIRELEIRLRRKDGQPVWVLISASPIAYGGAQAVMVTIQNISDRKKADDDLKRYAAELALSNKELETFAYSLSHDLRAPLRALDGFSQAVLDDYYDKLDDVGKDYLARIRGAAQNMAQITEDMLKLSRVIRYELRWETVNLSDTVSEIAQSLLDKEPERKVVFEIAQDINAHGDSSLLHIALYNLVENAWKFSAKVAQPRIEFSVIRQDQTEVYYVKDNGAGFDMQYSDKLFQPFQRLHADRDFPGHGIGLATVQRVIRRHGGRIWAESEPGKGTIIYFTLGDDEHQI